MNMRTKKLQELVKRTEDPGVNINNAIPGNPQEPTSADNKNTPKVETVDKSNTK